MLKYIEPRITKITYDPIFQYGLLAAITMLAATLRFYKLGDWSFWIDEIFTLGHVNAHYRSLETIVQNILPSRNWVPISLILTGGSLNALDISEWSARLIPAIIGIISIPVLYFPVKRAFNVSVGLIASLLLAVSPWHLFWSQNARFYTALMLFYFLAILAFFVAIEHDRPIYILIGFFLSYLAASERLLALFLVPVMVCYLLLLKIMPIEKPPGLRMRNLLLITLPIIALSFFQAYKYVTTGDFVLSELSYFVGEMNTTPLRLSASIAYRIGVPVLILGGFAGIYLISFRQRAGLFVFVAALLPVVLLLLLSLFSFTVDRYIFVTLPFWIILAAVGVQALFEQTRGQVRLLVIGILLLLVLDYLNNDFLYYKFQNGNRPDWRAAFNLLEQHEQEGDLVFATRPQLGSYYLTEDVQSIYDLDLESILSTENRTWFVIDEATSTISPNLGAWIIDNSILVDVLDVNLPGKSLSIRLYLYVPTEDS